MAKQRFLHPGAGAIRVAAAFLFIAPVAVGGETSARAGAAATATETATTADAIRLRPYLVVATRTPLGLDRVSPSVSYISDEEMELWQDRGLFKTLTRQSGVAVAQNGTAGSVGSFFVRGTESRHTAFLLDGRRLNPGLSNLFAFEHLSVNNLASVQLQKGASSVNYGSSGIGGVVDLRTRSGFDAADAGHVEGEIGSNEYRRGSGGLALAMDRWAVSFEASAMSTENERDNDAYERFASTQRIDYRLTDVLSFELVSHYVDAEKEAPGRTSSPSSFAYGETKNWLVSPGIRYATDKLSVHFFYSRSEFDREGVDDFLNLPFPFESSVVADELGMQVDFTVSKSILLTAGANYRNDEPWTSTRPGFDTHFEQIGGYLQAIIQVNDALELRGGLRGDHFSRYDDALTGRVEAIYSIGSIRTDLFAKVANSYSPPTAQDVIFDDEPSTSVDPEESVSYELGLRKNFEDKGLEIEMVYFRNDIDDLIIFEFDSSTFTNDGFNEDEALTEGIEAGFTYEPLAKNLSIWGSYTYLTAENESAGERLAKRPRHTIQAGVEFEASEELSLGLHATSYIDRVGFGGATLDDFVLVGLVGEWELTGAVNVFARVDNLFDKEYELAAGFPALGRAGYVGARFEF